MPCQPRQAFSVGAVRRGIRFQREVLKECFHADKFELAPRMGYRALYRVALAGRSFCTDQHGSRRLRGERC